jgi:hypothetical protein
LSAGLLTSLAAAVSLGLAAGTCGAGPPRAPSGAPIAAEDLDAVEPVSRRAYIERAQVWRPIRTESLDLLAGPRVPGAFAFDAEVTCDYEDDAGKLGGMTPKFLCRAGDEILKVKYGEDNGEVYAETAASRLFWALGFAADAVFPVRVTCRRCPVDPWLWKTAQKIEERTFPLATIERKFDAETIEVKDSAGWSWDELDLVDPAKGGAPRAHRDALRLLAVLVQHGDNKASQQRVVCLKQGVRRTARGQLCDKPLLVVSDLGATFGGAGNLSGGGAKMRFAQWSAKPIFREGADCVGELDGSIIGTLQHPSIHEAGRQFLAERLRRLTDKQIGDLFRAARVEQRGETIEEGGTKRPVTVADWVDAFKKKRHEITTRRCPR